jgi:hypothetical protein
VAFYLQSDDKISIEMVQFQTLINGHFRPVHEHNSEDYQLARLHSELVHSFKIKYFAYDCQNVPEDIDQPAMWFDFPNRLRESHPLNAHTFQLLMDRRNYTLPELQRLSWRYWERPLRDAFVTWSLQRFMSEVFSHDELSFCATRM